MFMSIEQPLNFLLPEDLARQLGGRSRALRLAANLTRETLSERSGVPPSTIRKFEVTGIIGLIGLVHLADALDCLDDFSKLFPPKVAVTIDEFVAPTRKRGRK
jgi:transcriptional regulator with XRE-family HTH domain